MVRSGALRDKSLAELLLQLIYISFIFGYQGLLAGAFKCSSWTLHPFQRGIDKVVEFFAQRGCSTRGFVICTITALLLFKSHKELLGVTPYLWTSACPNVDLDWAPIFLEKIHAFKEESMLFICPAPVEATIFALLFCIRWGRVLALLATSLSRMGEKVGLSYLTDICTLQASIDSGLVWSWQGILRSSVFKIDADSITGLNSGIWEDARVSLTGVLDGQLDFVWARLDGGFAFWLKLMNSTISNGLLGHRRVEDWLAKTLIAVFLFRVGGVCLPKKGLAELGANLWLYIFYIFWARFDFVETHFVNF